MACISHSAALAILLVLALHPGCAHSAAPGQGARQIVEAEELVAVVPMNLPKVRQRIDEILDESSIEHSSFGSLSWAIAVPGGRGWEARARLCADPVTRVWVLPATLRPQD